MRQYWQNPISRFAILFVLAYAGLLLIGNFAGGRAVYRDAVASTSNGIFQGWWSRGIAVVRPPEKAPEGMDTEIVLVNRQSYIDAQRTPGTTMFSIREYFSSYHRGFLLTVFLLALVIAAPISTRRKLLGGGIAFLLLQAFILFRVWITISYLIQQNPRLDIMNYDDISSWLIINMDLLLVKNIVVAFVIPLLLCAAILFRKSDLQIFTQPR